jgi:hypothetical protein
MRLSPFVWQMIRLRLSKPAHLALVRSANHLSVMQEVVSQLMMKSGPNAIVRLIARISMSGRIKNVGVAIRLIMSQRLKVWVITSRIS